MASTFYKPPIPEPIAPSQPLLICPLELLAAFCSSEADGEDYFRSPFQYVLYRGAGVGWGVGGVVSSIRFCRLLSACLQWRTTRRKQCRRHQILQD